MGECFGGMSITFASAKRHYAEKGVKVKGRAVEGRMKSELKREKVLKNKETRNRGQKKSSGGEEGPCESGWRKEE